ncbi:hypothetical protein SAMN02745181_0111 [Rubritalea squalenifaciens DSM 18772]|uniref:Uncharacterized protein n=1 Tax=Rubritalea squalenifaciens DSM 18772 TaxID=1123071 RepID=A0A1M6B3R2_9BACT|nr:hypothetical protein [Rubritalea squalenifaciens]SHI43384.1 hypothetical protein SAMN02745181_0111 [Rubritalea squalenifaciens DSM 18772]
MRDESDCLSLKYCLVIVFSETVSNKIMDGADLIAAAMIKAQNNNIGYKFVIADDSAYDMTACVAKLNQALQQQQSNLVFSADDIIIQSF